MVIVECIKKVKFKWEWATIFHILINSPIPQVGQRYIVEEYLSFSGLTFYKLQGFDNYFQSTYFEFVTHNTVNDNNVKNLVLELVTSDKHLN